MTSTPIVFIHGIRLSGSMWNTVTPALAGAHQLATPDLPGHGRRRGERFTLDTAVEAVAACIDELGGRALLVGISLGGYVGIASAARYPGRVAGLVAMGCTAQPNAFTSMLYRALGSLAARHPELAARLSERALRRTLPQSLAEACVAGGQSCEVIPQVASELRGHDYGALLARYPGKVWFINGATDPFRMHERRFLRACVDGQLTVIPRRGHLTTLVDHQALARHLHACARQVARTLAVDSDNRPESRVVSAARRRS